MNIMPPISGYVITELTIKFMNSDNSESEDIGSWNIQFVDEGGGFYPVIKIDPNNTLQLNPDELIKLGKWAEKMCKVLEKHSYHPGDKNDSP